MYYIFAGIRFIADSDDLKAAVLQKNNNVVNIGAVTDEFIFFQAVTDKPFFAVYISFVFAAAT